MLTDKLACSICEVYNGIYDNITSTTDNLHGSGYNNNGGVMEIINHEQKCRGKRVVEYIAPTTERPKVLEHIKNCHEELYSESHYLEGGCEMVQIFSTRGMRGV